MVEPTRQCDPQGSLTSLALRWSPRVGPQVHPLSSKSKEPTQQGYQIADPVPRIFT